MNDSLMPITPSESDSPQPVASEAEIDALEYVVHQGIIGAYDRPILLAWLARLQAERTPPPPSTPSEGTRQAGCIVTRLRQTRADMLGTDDEDHYWDCHEAAAEIARLRQWATLTDAEREAVTFFAEAGVYWSTGEGVGYVRRLLGLLKRLA